MTSPSPRPKPDLTKAASALLLFGFVGASVVLIAEYSVGAAWVPDFIRANELAPDQRLVLLGAMAGGAAAGILIAAVLMFRAWRWRKDLGAVVRLGWFLSPLMVIAFLPILFMREIWQKQLLLLLVSTGLLAFALEGAVLRALRDAPESIRHIWVSGVSRLQPATRRSFKHLAPVLVVALGAIGYATFMGFFTIRRHHNLQTANFDTAIQNQLMASALEGQWLESPVCMGKDGANFLTNHAQFGMHIFLPIYAMAPRVETLLVLESVLLGAGAIPLFLFARRRLSEWQAALVSLAYLAYFPMHGANFYEIQYIPIASTFVLWTVWAVDARRWIAFGILFVLALSMREDTSISLAVIGTFLLFSGHRPRAGILMAVVSVVYFAVMRFYVMPMAGPWWFHDMYESLCPPDESGFRCVIQTIVSNPLFVLKHMLTEKKLLFTLQLFTPLAFLPLRRSYLWVGFVPGIIPTILTTDYDPTLRIGFQYPMAWTPLLFLSVPVVLASLKETGLHRVRAALTAMAFASLVLTFNLGAFPRHDTFIGGFGPVDFTWDERSRDRYANLRELAALIPDDASVSATTTVGPHVSSRYAMYNLEFGAQKADYIFVRKADISPKNIEPLKHALEDDTYGVVARRGEFVLLKRGHDASANEQLRKDWGL